MKKRSNSALARTGYDDEYWYDDNYDDNDYYWYGEDDEYDDYDDYYLYMEAQENLRKAEEEYELARYLTNGKRKQRYEQYGY